VTKRTHGLFLLATIPAIGNAKRSQNRRVSDTAFEYTATAERNTETTAGAAEEAEQSNFHG
jgi:hypothetical protein